MTKKGNWNGTLPTDNKGERISPLISYFKLPNFRMKNFDTIAKMSMGALLTILVSVGGQYILNNNAKDKCRLNTDWHLTVINSFIGDTFGCIPHPEWGLRPR